MSRSTKKVVRLSATQKIALAAIATDEVRYIPPPTWTVNSRDTPELVFDTIRPTTRRTLQSLVRNGLARIDKNVGRHPLLRRNLVILTEAGRKALENVSVVWLFDQINACKKQRTS